MLAMNILTLSLPCCFRTISEPYFFSCMHSEYFDFQCCWDGRGRGPVLITTLSCFTWRGHPRDSIPCLGGQCHSQAQTYLHKVHLVWDWNTEFFNCLDECG